MRCVGRYREFANSRRRVNGGATHLEAKSKPEDRRKQLEEVLAQIKAIENPVVIAGDMNTSGTDSVPTSFPREVKKRLGSSSFWVQKGIKYASGVGLVYDLTLGLVKAQRMKHDPTVKSVRFVSENPEEKFFTTLKDFRLRMVARSTSGVQNSSRWEAVKRRSRIQMSALRRDSLVHWS